jgi:hypothetical protein
VKVILHRARSAEIYDYCHQVGKDCFGIENSLTGAMIMKCEQNGQQGKMLALSAILFT